MLTEIEDIGNSVMVRWAIYWTYLGRFNFRGHKGEESADIHGKIREIAPTYQSEKQ